MQDDILIRPYALTDAGAKANGANKSDEAGVIALWAEAFADDPAYNDSAAMIRAKMAVQPELFLVADCGGRIVGTVMAGHDGVRGWLHRLAVAEGFRRRGVATRLVREAERGLRRLGCPKVNLQVRATNAAVVAFYESLGYLVEDHLSLGRRLEDGES